VVQGWFAVAPGQDVQVANTISNPVFSYYAENASGSFSIIGNGFDNLQYVPVDHSEQFTHALDATADTSPTAAVTRSFRTVDTGGTASYTVILTGGA
jgi:hypothetical protein